MKRPTAVSRFKPVAAAARRLWQIALFYLLLIHLAGMLLTWNLVSLLAYPFLPRRPGTVVGRAAIASMYRGFWATAEWCGLMRMDATALDALSGDAGLIIAANHPSMLDALIVIARVPRGICIMRASLMRNPFVGAGALLARYIRNDPPRSMIRSAVANLKAGGQLLLFPEGTRTVAAPINPFRPGLTLIAQHAQVPIQTVIIETGSPYLGKGWPIWRAPPFPVEFSARLGERFAPEADHRRLLAQLECYFATELGAADWPPGRMTAAGRGAKARASTTHAVLIPSYDTGPTVYATVAAARAQWDPVWVVVDGSTDGTAEGLTERAAADPGLRLIVRSANAGKGAAVLLGLEAMRHAGFSHALAMDADGQHPAAMIPTFMRASAVRPDAMVLGRPVFDASAPRLRVRGRRVSNWWTNLETLGAGIADSLYGFRVYPVVPLIEVMRHQRWMRRFDFDTEAVVRLAWRGVVPINLDAPVKYLTADEGGVSHFRYGRDNALLTWMHLRLMAGFVRRLPGLVWRRVTHRPPFAPPGGQVQTGRGTRPRR